MPHNKSTKIDDQQNLSSIREEAITVKEEKFAKRPPSLNGVKKQQT